MRGPKQVVGILRRNVPAERNLFALVKNAALALRIHCDAGRFDEVFFREHREEVGIRLVIQLWYGPQRELSDQDPAWHRRIMMSGRRWKKEGALVSQMGTLEKRVGCVPLSMHNSNPSVHWLLVLPQLRFPNS